MKIINKKYCSECKKIKFLSEFNSHSGNKDGKQSQCRDCQKKYRETHKKYYKEYDKEYKKIHEKQTKKYNKEYRENHKEYYEEYDKKYRETHEKQLKKYDKKYRETHEKYYKEYHETHKSQHNKWLKERRKNPFIRLNSNISRGIRHSLHNNKNNKHWEMLVGYTGYQLKEHLEQLFTKGMNWLNYGSWHIDHIIPISLWKFESYDDPEFKQCWSLCNLQPLWAEDNLRKGNKVA